MGRGGDGVEIRGNSIRISFTHDGKVVRPTLKIDGKPIAPTKANITYARRLVQEIRGKLRLGLFSMSEYFPEEGAAADEITVDEQIKTFIAAKRIEGSTRDGYKSAQRFWSAAPIDDLGTQLGQQLVRSVLASQIMVAAASRPNLSGKTINNYLDVLRSAFDLAVLDKLIPENPAAEVERSKHQKSPPDPFEPSEREAILKDIRSRYEEQIWNLAEFWFWTGMRTSEIFGLQWEKIDFAKQIARVSEANVRGKQKRSTKTHTERDVKLNSRAMAALMRQRAHTYLANGFVFHDSRYDTPWGDERAFRRSYWTPCLRRLGIRYRRPYNMRHTYATTMLMAGLNHAFCARQLGHSVEVFLRTYARWIDGIQDEQEMGRLEAKLGGISLESPREKEKKKN